MYALEDNRHTKIFNAAIYVRLSREDERSTESESIANQKEYLTKYVLEQGWNLVDIFVDDGFTGTNFNRPDFKRLLKAIESKKINLVITKDMSRLGRDYIDTGFYIERYFPEHSVRYIALNDGIDTFANTSNNDMSPFKSVMNDMYAKDISKKVRTTVDLKRKNGEFIGSFAPYGYRKDPNDKNKLLVDQAVAWVVKKIFNMFVSGFGLIQISMALNKEGIPSPSAYKRKTSNYKGRGNGVDLWSFETVKYILTNPTYTGNVTQNRYVKINYKVSKLKKVPKESWITVSNTHEQIVDSETFNHAQQIFSVRDFSTKYAPKDGAHLLSGMIYCGDCGSRMTFITTSAGVFYAICTRYKNHRMCTRHSMPEKELELCIINELRNISAYASNQERLIKTAKKHAAKALNDSGIDYEIKEIETRLYEIQKTLKTLYEDKLKSIITEADFMDFSRDYNLEREKLHFKLTKLNQEKQKLHQQEKETDKLLNFVKDLTDFNNINKPLLVKLINRIDVYEQRKIAINYNFIKPF
ncbi:MAG: recombinase family protein [Deltaproteobacteria bacterium]